MKPLFRAALCATLPFAALPVAALAHDFTGGDMVIGHPFAYETTPVAKAAGGYFTLTNTGETAEALIGVEADYPKVQVHLSEEVDGRATMTHMPRVEIAPGETVTFAPGGYHVMFMGLDGDAFEEGETIPATLIFEQAGRVEIGFAVESRDGDHAMKMEMDGDDHDDDDHMDHDSSGH